MQLKCNTYNQNGSPLWFVQDASEKNIHAQSPNYQYCTQESSMILGLTVSSDLSWKSYSKVIRKTTYRICTLHRTSRYFPSPNHSLPWQINYPSTALMEYTLHCCCCCMWVGVLKNTPQSSWMSKKASWPFFGKFLNFVTKCTILERRSYVYIIQITLHESGTWTLWLEKDKILQRMDRKMLCGGQGGQKEVDEEEVMVMRRNRWKWLGRENKRGFCLDEEDQNDGSVTEGTT